MQVELNEHELAFALWLSERRMARTPWYKGMDDVSRIKNQRALSGACGEIAGAKFFDAYPHFVTEYSPEDITGWEFRTTSYRDGKLIVYERDRNDLKLALVVDSNPIFELVGWIEVSEVKRRFELEEKRKGGAAYWVPQNALKDFSEIKS